MGSIKALAPIEGMKCVDGVEQAQGGGITDIVLKSIFTEKQKRFLPPAKFHSISKHNLLTK